MSNTVETAAEFISVSVNVATDSTTVYGSPVILRGISVVTALSAHAMPVTDGTTTLFNMPASSGIGTWLECGDARMTSLVIDPDNDGTGTITVVYKPDHSGQAA